MGPEKNSGMELSGGAVSVRLLGGKGMLPAP